jgi:hypothetical protein
LILGYIEHIEQREKTAKNKSLSDDYTAEGDAA